MGIKQLKRSARRKLILFCFWLNSTLYGRPTTTEKEPHLSFVSLQEAKRQKYL